jgi:hypothetical protein
MNYSAQKFQKGERPQPFYLREKRDFKEFKRIANQIDGEILSGWRTTLRVGGNFFRKIKSEAAKTGKTNPHIEQMEQVAAARKKQIMAGAGQVFFQEDKTVQGMGVKKEPPPPPSPHTAQTPAKIHACSGVVV